LSTGLTRGPWRFGGRAVSLWSAFAVVRDILGRVCRLVEGRVSFINGVTECGLRHGCVRGAQETGTHNSQQRHCFFT
jgi:hypothetical protein